MLSINANCTLCIFYSFHWGKKKKGGVTFRALHRFRTQTAKLSLLNKVSWQSRNIYFSFSQDCPGNTTFP